jgi:hypothetical protein
MAHGLAERFGAVVMRLCDREVGVHVAALVIDEVRVLPRSAVSLHPKARVVNDDFVDYGAYRHWFVGSWRIGQRGVWRFRDAVWTHVASTSASEQNMAAAGKRSKAATAEQSGL